MSVGGVFREILGDVSDDLFPKISGLRSSQNMLVCQHKGGDPGDAPLAGMGVAPAGVEKAKTGHHHLLIDIDELPDFNQPLPATDNIIHLDKGQSKTRLDLGEGQHRLQLVLADYRHVPHEPPIVSEPITITVSANTPLPTETEKN